MSITACFFLLLFKLKSGFGNCLEHCLPIEWLRMKSDIVTELKILNNLKRLILSFSRLNSKNIMQYYPNVLKYWDN